MNKQEIKDKWETAYKLAISLTSDKFTYHSTKDNVSISKADDDRGTIVRGEVIVRSCKADDFIDLLIVKDLNTRKKFDPKTRTFENLDSFEDETGAWKLRYYVAASPSMMVSDRDFLYVEHHFREGNSVILVTTSVDGSFTCNKSTGVRGTNVFTFFKLTELENGDLNAVFMGLACPNGLIPTSISNSVVYERPLILSAAANLLGKTTSAIQK